MLHEFKTTLWPQEAREEERLRQKAEAEDGVLFSPKSCAF